MPARAEVELDIFSGMPNPVWILTDAEAASFVKKMAALSRTTATEISGKLGYRGFIVRLTEDAETHFIRVQFGAVHVSKGTTNLYLKDEHRELERWLLNSGRPHLESELWQIADREFP